MGSIISVPELAAGVFRPHPRSKFFPDCRVPNGEVPAGILHLWEELTCLLNRNKLLLIETTIIGLNNKIFIIEAMQ